MSQNYVIRLFLPIGWQATVSSLPAARAGSEVLSAETPFRLHNQGVDVYLRDSVQHEALAAGLSAGETLSRVLWFDDAPDAAAVRNATSSSSLHVMGLTDRVLQRGANGRDPPLIVLLGVKPISWGGRSTNVPKAALVTPETGKPLQLQVFLYDEWSWRQVAWTDSNCQTAGSAAAPAGALADPLPLRLALQNRRTSGLRDRGWRARLSSATAPAGTVAGATAAAAAGGVGRHGVSAAAGAETKAARAHSSLAAACALLHRAAAGGLESIVTHSASVRQVQHIASCMGALYGMYRSHCFVRAGADSCFRALPRIAAAQPHPHGGRGRPALLLGAAGGSPKGPPATEAKGSADFSPQRQKGVGTSVWKQRKLAGGWTAQTDVRDGDGGGCVKPHAASVAPQLPVSLLPAGSSGRAAVAAAIVLLSLLLQLLAGPVLAAAVWRRRGRLMAATERVAMSGERLLSEQYEWLATATPAGVKLHAELCALLGAAAQAILRAAATAARWGWPRCGAAMVGLLAVGTAATGLGGGLAVLHDLLLLAAAPLTLQAALSSLLLRCQLSWLRASWELLRGRRGGAAARRRHTQPRTAPAPAQTAGSAEPIGAAGAAAAVAPEEAAAMAAAPAPTAAAQRLQLAGRATAAPVQGCQGAAADGRCQESLRAVQRLWRGGGRSGEGGKQRAQGHDDGYVRGPGPGPLLPICRLESLMGLAPDPGSDNEVVVEPLIVGVLLLVPLLALLPTVAAWHVLALAAWGAPAAARSALALAAGLLRENALLALGWRAVRPLDFAGPDLMVHCIAVGLPASRTARSRHVDVYGRGATRSDTQCHPLDAASCCYVVEPLPQSWERVAVTWMARGLRDRWGPERFGRGQQGTARITRGGVRSVVVRRFWGLA